MPSCNTYHLTWVSLTLAWGISSRLLQESTATVPNLDEGYLLTATCPDLQHGIAPLGPPVPAQPPLLRLLFPAAGPGLWHGGPPSCRTWPRAPGGSSRSPPLAIQIRTLKWLFSNCIYFSSVQFSSVTQSCQTLCDPMNRSTPGLPVHHQLPEFTQTQVHQVRDAIQPSHPLSSPSPPTPNPSQHPSLFQ